MTRQERNELIMKCLSKSRDIDIERAYELADMAVRGDHPDETFSEDECLIFVDYQLLVREYQQSKGDLA